MYSVRKNIQQKKVFLFSSDFSVSEELRKESVIRKESLAKKRPEPLKLDSPKQLLLLRDMLNSPANKTVSCTFII